MNLKYSCTTTVKEVHPYFSPLLPYHFPRKYYVCFFIADHSEMRNVRKFTLYHFLFLKVMATTNLSVKSTKQRQPM